MNLGENLRSRAYKEIKQKIVLSELRQGEKIFESDMVELMNISRTPIREALLLLENEGLVEYSKKQGFTVRRIDVREVEEYFTYRELLESNSAEMIVKNITDEQLAKIEACFEKQSILYREKKINDFILCNFEFHDLIWQASGSAIYKALITTLNNMFVIIPVLKARVPKGIERAFSGHQKIMIALETRDALELKNALVEHLHDSKPFNFGVELISM